MTTEITLPRLSESLAALRDSYFDTASKAAGEGNDGAHISGEQLRAMGRYLDQLVDQAIGLELDVGEMEAIAADLDAAGSLTLGERKRAGVVRVAITAGDTNVVVFPIVRRSAEAGHGGDAA